MSVLTECPLGAQSYSFRQFDFEGSIQCLKDLGLSVMEYCAVHFPPDASEQGFVTIKERLAAQGVSVPCFGVEGFTEDAAANRAKFEFARALGVQVLSADPTPESFDNLDALTEEYGIRIAIHNHGPGARYDKVSDTLDAIRGHRRAIGACLDTGHALRSNEAPHEVVQQLGPRVISVHLKDWKIGGDEQIIGEGDMDLVAMARALQAIQFTGPIVFEYEESPDNPVPDMAIGLANWRQACEQA